MVTSHRLLWLKYWRVNMKSKWRLTTVPFKGSSLFGAALDSVLVEGHDKKKVIPSSYRRPDRRYSPYPRQPFHTENGTSSSYFRGPCLSIIPHQTKLPFVTGADIK